VPTERPTPSHILELLADHGPQTQWLPAPVQAMIRARTAPHEPTQQAAPVAGAELLRTARLLDEAEQIARAIPNGYHRADALIYVAAVVGRFDRAHAARLLDDAQHPNWHDGMPRLGPEKILERLLTTSVVEVGMRVHAELRRRGRRHVLEREPRKVNEVCSYEPRLLRADINVVGYLARKPEEAERT
jgi:hypothetical protein